MSAAKPDGKKISRRDLFRVTGAAGAGLALEAGGYAALSGAADARDAGGEAAVLPDLQTVAYRDVHQAGIATTQPEHMHFAALDLVTHEVSEVRDLLHAWSEAAERMTQGETAGDDNFS